MELHHDLHLRKLKTPFPISVMFRRIEAAVKPYPKAMLFELAEMGFVSPFEQLVSCIISVRTLDEVSREASLRLLKAANTPLKVGALEEAQIADLIRPATFYRQKAKTIRDIALEVQKPFRGNLFSRHNLLSLKGVGPKCANLVLGIAAGERYIAVDTHVHRIANRWGYVATVSPQGTRRALERKLPKELWIDINRLLVPFGKHICTWARPKCSSCPVTGICQKVGVTNPR